VIVLASGDFNFCVVAFFNFPVPMGEAETADDRDGDRVGGNPAHAGSSAPYEPVYGPEESPATLERRAAQAANRAIYEQDPYRDDYGFTDSESDLDEEAHLAAGDHGFYLHPDPFVRAATDRPAGAPRQNLFGCGHAFPSNRAWAWARQITRRYNPFVTNQFYNPQPIDPNAPFPQQMFFTDFLCFDIPVITLAELLPHPCLATLGGRTRCAPLQPRANNATKTTAAAAAAIVQAAQATHSGPWIVRARWRSSVLGYPQATGLV
jgi:hypothetical protein